jgi:hypothetical protein
MGKKCMHLSKFNNSERYATQQKNNIMEVCIINPTNLSFRFRKLYNYLVLLCGSSLLLLIHFSRTSVDPS